MKTRIWLFLMAVVAMSCTREALSTPEQIEETVNSVSGYYPEKVYARIESSDDSDTKVFADENLKVLWDNDDRISLFNKYTYDKQYRFTGNTGDNSGEFVDVNPEAVVTGNALDYVYSVYPYKTGTTISNAGIISLRLPAEQTYRENTFGLGANTMVSATANTELLFKNLCGYLVLKLYGDNVSVSSITFRGNDNETLAGNGNVTASLDSAPVFAFEKSGSSISINPTSITLTCPTPVTLGSTAENATVFWLVVPPTTFSNGFTIIVKDSNNNTFEKSISSELAINRNTTLRMKALKVDIINPVPVAVDLGLSVKWASFNVGANKPEGYGNYYAYGETIGYGEEYVKNSANYAFNNYESYIKYVYCFETHRWNAGWAKVALTKYNDVPEYGYKGFADFKTVLEPQDDAASVNWGINWRTPSNAEWEELANKANCTWSLETINGVEGFRVTSKKAGYTDASIFLPFAGSFSRYDNQGTRNYGRYMSSNIWELPDKEIDASMERCFWINKDGLYNTSTAFREYGYSVRPVYYEPETGVLGVDLDQPTLRLMVNENADLTASVFPNNSSNKAITWSSSDISVATVTSSGHVTARKVGTAVITVTTVDNSKTASCIVSVGESGAIDLGLSVEWASYNVGATKPEEYGNYYAWGETEPKSDYSWSTYNFGTSKDGPFSKYNTNSSYGIVDNKTVLDPEDDVALVKLGGSWRMPTKDEWDELDKNSLKEWTYNYNGTGVSGTIVKAKNGNSIFLPAAGYRYDTNLINAGSYGYYWSSSLNADSPSYAWYVYFYSDYDRYSGLRYYGQSVRPVSE